MYKLFFNKLDYKKYLSLSTLLSGEKREIVSDSVLPEGGHLKAMSLGEITRQWIFKQEQRIWGPGHPNTETSERPKGGGEGGSGGKPGQQGSGNGECLQDWGGTELLSPEGQAGGDLGARISLDSRELKVVLMNICLASLWEGRGEEERLGMERSKVGQEEDVQSQDGGQEVTRGPSKALSSFPTGSSQA